MKILQSTLVFLFLAHFFSCGDAGVQLNISKVVGYEYEVNALNTNGNGGNLNQSSTIDLGSVEFDRYNITEVVLESIEYEISGLPDDYEDQFSKQLIVSGNRLPAVQLVETPANSNFRNSGEERVLMYSDLTPNQLVNLEAVNAIETLIRQGEDFDMLVTTAFPDLPNDFRITYYFDVLVKVRE